MGYFTCGKIDECVVRVVSAEDCIVPRSSEEISRLRDFPIVKVLTASKNLSHFMAFLHRKYKITLLLGSSRIFFITTR